MSQSMVDLRQNTMSNDDHRDVLETKRVEIVHCLNFERTLLLSYLRSKRVFDVDDCEHIMAEKTNRGRAGKLIDFLLKKDSEAYEYFLDVIQVDNANLYETLTGEKASSRPSPIINQLANHELLDEDGNNFPKQILVEHLQRTYGDLHEINLKYFSVLKEKNGLEEKLLKTESNLEFEIERRTEYEKRVSKVFQADENVEASNVFLLNECDDLQKAIADRDVYIIALQMKLLAEKDQSDGLRSKLGEIEQKNETIGCQLRRISENYNQERGHSLRLNERIQKMGELEKQVNQAKFENILVQDERNEIEENLKELKKWAEALKARFDAEVDEKNKVMAKNENFDKLQETLRNLQRKLTLSQVEISDCKLRSERLEKDSEIYRNQRDRVLEARKESILERDKVIAEKEIIQMQYNELQSKYEKFNQERETLFQDYDATKKRYETTMQELGEVKIKLNEKEMEAEDLNRLLIEAEEKNRRNSQLMEIIPPQSQFKRMSVSHESDDGAKKQGEKNAHANPWRERRLKSLLKSIKLRIAGEQIEKDIEDDNMTDDNDSPVPATMTWELLQVILPNLSSRPYSSLQRMNWQDGATNDGETSQERKSNTLPVMKPSSSMNYISDAEKPFADNFTKPFRERSKPITKHYQRSKSVI